jgi:hypothetical protein
MTPRANHMLALVPSLDEIVRNPESAADLPKAAILTLLMQCITAQSALTVAFGMQENDNDCPGHEEAADPLLDAKAAASRLATNTDWLYRNADSLPFAVRLSEGQLRFSSQGITRFIQTRQGKRKC